MQPRRGPVVAFRFSSGSIMMEQAETRSCSSSEFLVSGPSMTVVPLETSSVASTLAVDEKKNFKF